MKKYVIIKPDEYCGMFGCLWQVIRGIYHNPDNLYYINFYDSIYNTKNENVFDYFFYQPHTEIFPDSSKIEKIVGHNSLPDNKEDSQFIWSLIQPNTKEEIQRRRIIFNSIINKYLKLKPTVQEKIDLFTLKNFLGKKILGVHLRGTDHPYKQPINVYIDEIKKIESLYDKIFVTSDEQPRFDAVKNVFGEKVISYDALRSSIEHTPLHMNLYETRWHRNPSHEYQYKIAEDVIIEAYLMAKTDFLCCFSGSNVNTYARALNPNLESMEL